MTSVGIMASGVAAGTCTDVLQEPFDNFTAAPWTLNGSPTIVAGRNGNAANVTGVSQRLNYAIPSIDQSDTVTIGFAYRTPAFQNLSLIMRLYSDTNTTNHTGLSVGTTGGLMADRGGVSVATSAAGTLTVDTWHYIEMQAKMHDTTGSIIVRVDGVEVINFTGDTKAGGTKAVYDAVRLGAVNGSSGGTNQYDDLYLSTGSACTFQGDHAVPSASVVFADNFNRADGGLGSEWTKHTGADPAIVGNKVSATYSGTAEMTASFNHALAADQWAEADVTTTVTATDSGIMVPVARVSSDGQSLYYPWINPAGPAVALWRRVSGGYANVYGSEVPIASKNCKLRIEAQGTTLRVYVDGVLKITATDSNLATGKAGIWQYLNATGTITLDNFRCGELPYTP